ncbi:MAG: hypothetical protein HXO61_09090 [Rothia mucilaginosa]|uniref:Uncharacterized protein n=1 Tax=Rothia mucilaginosa TaxID=43675 RepID=A0A930PQ50_9MICC|nr:hypothetical protein [Rothia mucilaginosa]MBF1658064.1 hypothetical protein [Rothia mucilaginosa]
MMQKKMEGAYRRVFGTLKQAQEFRDDFYASYGVQPAAPGTHIHQEGEGWVVEFTAAEQLKFAQDVYRRLMLHPEAEPTCAFRFVWVRRPVPQKDSQKEQDCILFNVMMHLRTFTPQQMSWQLLALSTYRAWDIDKIPDRQERAKYEAQVVKDFRIGSHTLAPTMVGLYPEYAEFTVDPELMSISSLRYLMHYEAQEDRDLEDEGDALRKEKWVARSRTQFNRRLVQMAEELRAHNVVIADTCSFARRVSWLDDNGYFNQDTGALSSQKEDYPGFYGEVLSGRHLVSIQLYGIQRADGKFLSKINDQAPVDLGFGAWFGDVGLQMTSLRARQVMGLLQCEDVTLVPVGDIED